MGKPLHDGSKIYDTPKYTGGVPGTIAGYNCGFDRSPTYAVGSNCKYTAHWERLLFREVLSIFDFAIPETWDRDFTLWVLFRNGYFAILKNATVTGENGKALYTAPDLPQACTLAGVNVFYHPTRAVVGNPRIKNQQWKIGKDCAIIRLTPDYSGIWDIVHEYAETLATLTQSLKMSIVNTRLVDGYVVDKNADAALVTAILDGVENGKPNYIVNARIEKDQNGDLVKPWVEFHNDVGRNYIVDKLQAAIEKELNAFRRLIGVPQLSDKKERLVNSEIDTVVGYAQSEIDVYYDTLKRSIEEAKKVFPGLTFDVRKLDFAQNEGSEE